MTATSPTAVPGIDDTRIAQIVEMTITLDDAGRETLLDKLSEVMCLHCGTDVRGSGPCYCWNDE